ncbi:MAG TPA: ribosome maturation factor RimM [Casimicrobiaceae bacterium]|jgi:16S rRNA processing protein RimM
MARILTPYGIQGWIKARPYTASIATLLDYKTWWLAPARDAEAWREFTVRTARQHGDTLVAALDGLADREAALQWRGAWVGVPRSALPEPGTGEFYWSDLVGLVVVNRTAEQLGRVSKVLETGAHPVLHVESEDGAVLLIPVVAAYVDAIDPAAGRIMVDWPADF